MGSASANSRPEIFLLFILFQNIDNKLSFAL